MIATDREAYSESDAGWDSDVVRQHVRIVEGGGGPQACIVGSPIRVVDVMGWSERDGLEVAEILARFPQLTPADIHTALAFYWDNRALIDRQIADSDAYVEEMRRTQPSLLRDALGRSIQR